MLEQSSVNMRERSAAWKQSGWTGFDPASQPYGPDQVKERELYRVQ
jgi:hypothetical protein